MSDPAACVLLDDIEGSCDAAAALGITPRAGRQPRAGLDALDVVLAAPWGSHPELASAVAGRSAR